MNKKAIESPSKLYEHHHERRIDGTVSHTLKPTTEHHRQVIEAVRRYQSMGIAVTPVTYRAKNPIRTGWQKEELEPGAALKIFNDDHYNIGILNGTPSGTLDVDLDCNEAVMLAPSLLPPTPFVYGRDGNPASHYMYRVVGAEMPATRRIQDSSGMIVELRSTGTVTVAPPSIHPTGEIYSGTVDQVPANVEPKLLGCRVALLGAGVVLLRHYPTDGTRHNTALALGGLFARYGLPQRYAVMLVKVVAEVAGDEEAEDRLRALADAYGAFEKGESCGGYPKLVSFLGKDAVDRIVKILGLKAPPNQDVANDDAEALILNASKELKDVRHNVVTCLNQSEVWRDVLAYDERAGRVVFKKAPPLFGVTQIPTALTDVHVLNIAQWMTKQRSVSFSTSVMHEGIALVANEHKFDPVVDYLEAVEPIWDGKDRLTTFTATYLNSDDTPYTRMVGPMWMVSAVARALKPGCQADHMLVLESGQGLGKSSALRALGVGYHRADPPNVCQTKDFKEWLQDVWIAELSEMDSMRKAEATAIKTLLTETVDRYRAPYDKYPTDHPRRAVFIGTTNETGYLRDTTGNRRIWPISCGGDPIDVAKIERDRDQLWAEACVRYKRGERWWPDTAEQKELCEKEQALRVVTDEYGMDIVEAADLEVKEYGYASVESILQRLGATNKQYPNNMSQRIGQNLTARGWKRSTKRQDGRKPTVYYPPMTKLE